MVADIRPKTAGCGKQECIRVIVRCRPLSAKEIAENHPSIVSCHPQRGVIELKTSPNSSELSKDFTFDAVYNESSKQTDLYDESFRDLVDSVLNGFNGTIFAYGQTGTGKTYTMEGKPTPSEKGVIYNCIDHIFDHIANSKNQQFLVRASYMEIYKEEIRDLLSKDLNARLELKERADSGVYVKGLSTFMTRSADEIQKVMSVGNANRSVGPTNMNEHSSRSHAIFTITVECSDIDMTGESHIRVGKLNLVDLAGSERQAKTGATGERFKEATKINLSLSALGNVISALVDGKSSHIPYRDSKLTRLLQDSLGGNSKTVMVACIGPASYNYEETLGTLRYANRAKNIKNKPKINEDPKDALLREFQDEIIRLRSMLEKRKGKKDGHERGEDYFRNEQYTLEMDRDRVMKDESLVQEERLRIVETIEERERMLQNEKQNQAKVLERIKTMESKLLGGVDLIDQTREQQMELERRRLELAEQKRREREVLQQLEKQEEDTVEIHQTFANLQQEVEAKSKKLMKFKMKLKKIRSEMQDASILHSQERRDLERDVSEINKELKLKLLIVDNFIPLNIRERIKERAIWSEEESNWSCPGARPLSADSHPVVENILLGDDQGVLTRSIGADSGVSCEAGPSKSNDLFEKRPLSNPGLRRPVSSHEVELVKRAQRHLTKLERPPMEALQGPQPILNEEILRFCGENVLVFSGLERIQDNVKEYDESEINPSSHRQKDITIDATPSVRTRLRSPSITGLNSNFLQPPTPPDPVICTENALKVDSFKMSCSSSETSESEGICADYIYQNNKVYDPDEYLWSDSVGTRFPGVQNMDQSVDLRDYLLLERRAFSVPRSTSNYMNSSMEGTPRLSKIPVSIRPMSQSFSAYNSPFSTPRRPERATKSLNETVDGSCEQLCEDFVDVQQEARLLLARSRARNHHRLQLDDRWLMQPADLTRSLSVSFRDSSPKPSTRLLNRPRMSRTVEDIHAARTSMWLSKLRSDIESFVDGKSRSFDSDEDEMDDFTVSLEPSKKTFSCGKRPLSMEQLIRWYRISHSYCEVCRSTNRLRRLSRRSTRHKTSCPGVEKQGVVRRTQCICSRSSNLLFLFIPTPPYDPTFCYLTDWAAIFALIALLCKILLIFIS